MDNQARRSRDRNHLFSSAGRHRRVLLPDLVKYEENLRTERKAFLK